MYSDSENKAKVLQSMEWFCSRASFCTPTDLFGRGADDLEQEKEDLDNVNVDGERCKHVFFWADGVLPVPYQQLCVVC